MALVIMELLETTGMVAVGILLFEIDETMLASSYAAGFEVTVVASRLLRASEAGAVAVWQNFSRNTLPVAYLVTGCVKLVAWVVEMELVLIVRLHFSVIYRVAYSSEVVVPTNLDQALFRH